MVVCRRDLDDVGADNVQPSKATQGCQQLTRRQATCLGRSGSRRGGRVENVDVDRHVDQTAAQPRSHRGDHTIEPEPVVVGARNRGVAESLAVGQVGVGVQRSSDADMHGSSRVDQVLLGSAPERRAMGVRLAEVGVPCIEVRVEMKHGDLAMPPRNATQQRQRDRMVAAENQQSVRRAEHRLRRLLDLPDSDLDVEGVRCDVTSVGHLLHREGETCPGRGCTAAAGAMTAGCGPARTSHRVDS